MRKDKPKYPNPTMDELNSVVAATELTGLVQGLPHEELEMYSEVCDVPAQAGLDAIEHEMDAVMRKQQSQK